VIPALCRYRASASTPIAVVSTSQGGAEVAPPSFVGAVSIPAPSGIVAGNLLLAVFSCDDSTAPTTITSTGWTLLVTFQFSTRNNFGNIGVFWKIATASEPASYAFNGAACYAMNIGIIQLSGVNSASPFNGVAATARKAVAAVTPVFPAITLPKAMYVLQVVAQGGNFTNAVSTSYTPSADYTLAVSSTSQVNGYVTDDAEVTFAALSKARIAAGAYTPTSGTLSKSYQYGAVSVALNPAA
jgi:hypothetical protein